MDVEEVLSLRRIAKREIHNSSAEAEGYAREGCGGGGKERYGRDASTIRRSSRASMISSLVTRRTWCS